MSAAPVEAALAAAVLADPDDLHAIAVYADWLSEQGSPWGELMHLHDDRAWQACGLPDADHVRVRWRGAGWGALRVERTAPARAPAPDALARVYAAPPCLALRELALVDWDPFGGDQYARLFAEVAAQRWAAGLRALAVGHDHPPAMATRPLGDVARAIAAACPRLETLRLAGGSAANDPRSIDLDGLALRELRALTLAIASERVDVPASLDGCILPTLRVLTLEGAALGAIAHALVRPAPFAGVRRLGLHGLAVDVALDAVLPNAACAAELETLDLARSTLSGVGVRALIAHRGMFPALATIDVRETRIAEHHVATLRSSYPAALVIR